MRCVYKTALPVQAAKHRTSKCLLGVGLSGFKINYPISFYFRHKLSVLNSNTASAKQTNPRCIKAH